MWAEELVPDGVLLSPGVPPSAAGCSVPNAMLCWRGEGAHVALQHLETAAWLFLHGTVEVLGIFIVF